MKRFIIAAIAGLFIFFSANAQEAKTQDKPQMFKDFDVLSVAVSDKPENSIAAAKEHGVIWNQIVNAQSIPAKVYGFKYIPYIILIGADGTILETNLRGENIEKAVKKALGR